MFSKFFPISQSRSHAARAAIPATVGIAIGALAGLAMVAGPASAGVIYQDNFATPPSTSPLNGRSPTTGPNAATWSATTGTDEWTADGYALNNSSGGYLYASLPFAAPPVSGNIYTVSATLNPSNGRDGNLDWLGVGFSNSNEFTTGIGPWMLLRANGEVDTLSSGISNIAGFNNGYPMGATAQVVLNTTGSDWTAQLSYDGVDLWNYTYTGTGGNMPNPTGITTVGIESSYSPGNVGSFLFQNNLAVPEPASLGLMAVGALGLLLLRRRRAA